MEEIGKTKGRKGSARVERAPRGTLVLRGWEFVGRGRC